ncbi:MAG: RidA family protein [SAR202 cluster bacterium]|nr:RidA family protein [SAR202 cluster bacterium]
MGKIEDRLKQLNITLPSAQGPSANYVPCVRTGNMLYMSGVGPAKRADGTAPKGKVGKDLTVEQGYEAARLCGINLLARMQAELGTLDKVKRVVKVLGMVNSVDSLNQHPSVINGCSDLMVEIFGDKGRHARSAVGMNSLPFDIPVEVEMIVEIEA